MFSILPGWRVVGVTACIGLLAAGSGWGQTPDIQEGRYPDKYTAYLVGCAGNKTPIRALPGRSPAAVQFKVKRIATVSEKDLRQQLAALPEVKVGSEGVPKAVPTPWVPDKAVTPTFVMSKETLARRTDLAMLSVRMGKDCELDAARANDLRSLARDLRTAVANTRDGAYDDNDTEPIASVLRINFTRRGKAFMEDFSKPSAVPVLMQMLTPEPAAVRAVLAEQLARIPGKEASHGLAKLAVFDLDPEVRARALEALATRPRDDYRQALVDGLKYPWAPAANHAAEGLVALADTDALPLLQELAKQPAPDAVFENDAGQKMVRDVVRINHLMNCTLCHQLDKDREAKFRAAVPVPGYPLPPSTAYYAKGDVFVRADVTYLRQDFSVSHAVKDHGAWPEQQRYDYIVRTRPATAADQNHKADPALKQALEFAISELTSKKAALSRAAP
jgi:hypothetical protein